MIKLYVLYSNFSSPSPLFSIPCVLCVQRLTVPLGQYISAAASIHVVTQTRWEEKMRCFLRITFQEYFVTSYIYIPHIAEIFICKKFTRYEDSKILLGYYIVLHIIVVLRFLLKLIRNLVFYMDLIYHFSFYVSYVQDNLFFSYQAKPIQILNSYTC